VTELTTLLSSLRNILAGVVQPLVAGAPSIALLDFPAHSNVGDSAIWLGCLQLLREMDVPEPCYSCDTETYDRVTLARRLGRGTILFTGGGSFGDLWERHLHFRERVVADFPDNAIVQLPQSVHFRSAQSLDRARATFDKHPRLTILARDAASLDTVRREFRAPSFLAPDAAFGLGALPNGLEPNLDVLWLKRRDLEDRWMGAVPAGDAAVVDWTSEPRSAGIVLSRSLSHLHTLHPAFARLSRRVLEASYPRIARERLSRGVTLLQSARVVVTDRLHGHILALLLGIPHVILDNSYGKVHNFAAQWTSESALVHFASTPAQAASVARTLAAGMAH
jgi:pyruvyl transferase EpsO